jgi:hypothetical protein
MGLFRRDTTNSSARRRQPAVGANDRVELADDGSAESIEELEQIIVEGMREVPIAREILELLQVGLPYLVQRDCSDEAVIAGQTAARLGYLSRAAEFAMFDGELEVDDDLIQVLGDRLDAAEADGTSAWNALAELAAAMAIEESLDPSPEEGGPSWTLPGLGGDVRASLRDNLVSGMNPADVLGDDLKRTWKFGYFLRVLGELCD